MRKKLALLILALAALTAASTGPRTAAADTCPKGTHLIVCPDSSWCCPNNAFCFCL
jgi:hypothetical protein